jgi:radical SAM protein with 4Fe4S-binding SPASM domain
MTLESQPIRIPGNTRMCVLPFTTPSIEPDGGVRLCSAASIFHYLDETMMGSVHEGGLANVWNNAKFQKLRHALLSGTDLPPYCNRCDYRFEGPPWLLVLHIALLTYNRSQQKDADVADLIRRHEHRYSEYCSIAGQHGLWVEPLPTKLEHARLQVVDLLGGKPCSFVLQGEQMWADVTVALPKGFAARLTRTTELSIGWVNRFQDRPAAAPNLRISLEEQTPDRIAHAFFPAAPTSEGTETWRVDAFRRSVPDLDPDRLVRLRIGGFGERGSVVELRELALLITEAVNESPTQPGLAKLAEGSTLPVSIDLNTLNRCNVSCTMCPYAIKYDDLGEAKEPIYRLTLAEYKNITTGMNVESAHFVGAYAEPLMNKELFTMIAYAQAHGTRTAVTSNAMLLSRKFAEKMVDAGLQLLTVSLHGATKAVAEGIMRGSDFETVLGNIRTLQAVKRERGTDKPVIQINYVGQKANVRDLPAFVRLAESLGIRIIHLVHLLVTPGVQENESLVNHPEELTSNVREAEAIAKKLGVQLYVSSSYRAVIADFENGVRSH